MSKLSYAKWDNFEDSSDEEEEEAPKKLPDDGDELLHEGNRLLNHLIAREEDFGDEIPVAKYGEAVEIYGKVEAMTTDREILERAWLNGATAYYKMKDWAMAAEKAQKAFESACAETKDKALEIWESAMTELRTDVDEAFEKGDKALRAKDYQTAAQAFSGVTRFPGRYKAAALTKLAGVLELQHRHADAADVYAQAASDDAAFSSSLGIDSLNPNGGSTNEVELDDKRRKLRERALQLYDQCGTECALDALTVHKALVKELLKNYRSRRYKKNPSKFALSLAQRVRNVRQKHRETTGAVTMKELDDDSEIIEILNDGFNLALTRGPKDDEKGAANASAALLGDALSNELSYRNRFDEATTVARKAMRCFPEQRPNEDDNVKHARCGCALSLAFAASRCQKSDAKDLFVRAGNLAADVGRFDSAGDAMYRAVLLVEDDDDEIRLYADKAATYLTRAIETMEESPQLHLRLARALLASDRPGDAVKPAKKALVGFQKSKDTSDKTIFETMEILADALALTQNFFEAADVLDQATGLLRTTKLAWPNRAQDSARIATALATAREHTGNLDAAKLLWLACARQYDLLGDNFSAAAARKRSDTCVVLDLDDDTVVTGGSGGKKSSGSQ